MDKIKGTLSLKDLTSEQLQLLIGVNDNNLKIIEENLDVELNIYQENLVIRAKDQKMIDLIKKMFTIFITKAINKDLAQREVLYHCDSLINGVDIDYNKLNSLVLAVNTKKKPIKPKTNGQYDYIKSLMNSDLVFGVGPAGSGKTYLAVVYGVKLLKENKVKKIILTRPAVEAGESLGFLPGDMKEKVDPYLRPLYDALFDMLGEDSANKLIERQTIEIAPLAYMRGRTLEDAYVILDEAQNTTIQQMKMFLTRLGFNSQMVITGDITQVDLPNGIESGLRNAVKILQGVRGIEINMLTENDVVRNPLVRKIIQAYDKNK